MKWVSYTRSISSRIGEENPSNTIAEQNERIAQYLKKRGCSISEKYSDRKRTAEAAEGFDRLVQDGMARKFDAVVVDSIFRCGRTLPFAIEALQRTFYPLGIQFAVVEDDFCSADKTAEEVAEYFNGKTIDKIRSEFITNRQNHFEEGTLTHRQAKYGYALSEDRRNLVLNPESAQVVKLIFQMYLEDMKIPEIARALEAQGVPSPQIRQAIIEFRPRLVVIDPIQAYLGSDSDLQIAGRARKLMQRLGMWASVYDCAIVLIGHLNKKEGTKGLYRSLGSIDVVAAARSVLQVERDQKDTDIRIVRQIKNSLAPSDGEIRFSITAEMGFQWLECKSTFVSSEQPKVPEFESKTEKAAYLIKKLLSDGDMRAREIYMRMKDEGISRRTAENTKKELGIRSYRKMRQWYWSIHTGE